MKFDVPRIIHELPTKEYWRSVYPDHRLKTKLAYLTAIKVYIRTRLAEAQNWRCCWCGIKTIEEPMQQNSITIEHVTPRCQGGADDWENYAMSCLRCNQRRGTQSVEEFMNNVFTKPIEESKRRQRLHRKEKRKAQIARVWEAIKNLDTNPFEPDSKNFLMFERYKGNKNMAA